MNFDDTDILKLYCAASHNYALRKGFWDSEGDNQLHTWQIAKLSLIACEVSEAIEAIRENKSFAEELADIAIRLFDFCEAYGIDLKKAIREKMIINETRPDMHGKKA